MFGALLWLVALAAAVWVIYDVWTQQRKASTGEKVFWTVVAVLFSVVTAIVYYFVKKK